MTVGGEEEIDEARPAACAAALNCPLRTTPIVHPLSVQSSEVLLPPGYGLLLLTYVLLAYEARITTVSLSLATR